MRKVRRGVECEGQVCEVISQSARFDLSKMLNVNYGPLFMEMRVHPVWAHVLRTSHFFVPPPAIAKQISTLQKVIQKIWPADLTVGLNDI